MAATTPLPQVFDLIHATSVANAVSIAQHGIIASANGRWGAGVYGIPASDKDAASNAMNISKFRSPAGTGSAYVTLRVTLPSAPVQLGKTDEKDDGARNRIWVAGSNPAAFASHPAWAGCSEFREVVIRNAAHCVVQSLHLGDGSRVPSIVAPHVSVCVEGNVVFG